MRELVTILERKRPYCQHSVLIEELCMAPICALALHLNPCDGNSEERRNCPAWKVE